MSRSLARSTRRKPKPEPDYDEKRLKWNAWKRGNLDYLLREEQRQLKSLLYSMPLGVAVFNISRRFGKTTTCVVFADENARRKKQHIRYATAFLSDLEEFILPIFEQILADCPPSLRPKWRASKKRFVYPNGSVIKLVGVDKNPNGIRGNAIDILIIDEAAFVKNLKYLYRSIIVPATMKRKFKLIFPSTPPESPLHFWASDLIPRAKRRGSYVELTIDDISDLPREERERLLDEVGGEFSTTAQREFFCKIIADDERAVATQFNAGLHVQEYEPKLCYWQIFGDAGGIKDKTVILKVTYCHKLAKTIIRSELVFDRKTPTPQMLEAIEKAFPGMPIVLDAPGQTRVDFAHEGLSTVLPQKDDFQASLQFLNACLYKNEVLIHPDCIFLIQSLIGGLLNRSRSDFERTEELGHLDAIAALIYALRMVDKRDYFPEMAQLDRARYHVPELPPPPAVAELSKLASIGGF